MEGLWRVFDEDFAGHVLSFDGDAAGMYADIAASRRIADKPIGRFDAMIAAMARSLRRPTNFSIDRCATTVAVAGDPQNTGHEIKFQTS